MMLDEFGNATVADTNKSNVLSRSQLVNGFNR